MLERLCADEQYLDDDMLEDHFLSVSFSTLRQTLRERDALRRVAAAARWFRALDGLGARVYLDAGAHCDAETFLTGSSGDGLGRRVTFGHMAELGDALAALDALDGVPNRCSTCRGTGRYEQWYPDGANLDFHRRLGECPVCRGTGRLR